MVIPSRGANGARRSRDFPPASRFSVNGNRNGQNEPERPPRSWRVPDFRAIGRGARSTVRAVGRVLQLVWATSPRLTLSLAIVTLIQSVVPATQVWLAGRLID